MQPRSFRERVAYNAMERLEDINEKFTKGIYRESFEYLKLYLDKTQI
jgi:hypothetical protein